MAGEMLDPLGKFIGKIGIKPNHITIAGLFLARYAAWFLYNKDIFYAFFIGLIACLFDGAVQTSYSRAAAERLGVSQESIGVIERPERWFILGMGLLIGELLGDVETIITWVVAFLAIFGNITVVQRMYHFWNEAKDE